MNSQQKNHRQTSLFCLAMVATVMAFVPRAESAVNPNKTPPKKQNRRSFNVKALRLAINDLTKTYPERYAKGKDYLAELDSLCEKPDSEEKRQALFALQRRALLANPLLDFDKLILVKTKSWREDGGLQSLCNVRKTGQDCEILLMSMASPEKELVTLFEPEHDVWVGQVDLHFDANKILFSMPNNGGKGPWHVYEIEIDPSTGMMKKDSKPRQVSQTQDSLFDPDWEGYTERGKKGKRPIIDNFDACYLPDDRIMFTSTAGLVGEPCCAGLNQAATLFRMNRDGSDMRQLGFDQAHNWHPAVMQDGRVLYTRWDYTDQMHHNTRLLFTMNPDGTNQRAYYGSNSYWPDSMFYTRPVPGHPTKVATIITDYGLLQGKLMILDPALGTHEADGVVQKIPGYGKTVEGYNPLLYQKNPDYGRTVEGYNPPLCQPVANLYKRSWPKFLHPYPLSEKYYLVAMQPRGGKFGIYLVDVFDNILCLRKEPGFDLVEPVPLRKTKRPRIIPDKINKDRKDAVVYISDIYFGPGLKDIPRGEVKTLRLYTYSFGFQGVGGTEQIIGEDGPWDMRRTLGTVPVEPDGSAMFRVPANTPIAVQPLDREGKSMQIMRSWFTAMPGENVSCIGCHENPNDVPPARRSIAAGKAPADIAPWRGPARNFEFAREVQPVLDKYCVGCHNGEKRNGGKQLPDLRGTVYRGGFFRSYLLKGEGKFSIAYDNLHRYVRRPGITSPMPLMTPMEFHADTTELVQMLMKGHHNVKLDVEAWDRLITWIDFNAPFHGRWSTLVGDYAKLKEQQRAKFRKIYANLDENHEEMPEFKPEKIDPIIPKQAKTPPVRLKVEGWPLDAASAKELQASGGGASTTTRSVSLSDTVPMKFVRIPAGTFAMGSAEGYDDEAPMAKVRIAKGFWMGKFEVTNEQFRKFDPNHNSREEDRQGVMWGVRGYDVNKPKMPAVRLSWKQAVAFCEWLSKKTGKNVSLPTEAQWEWACRAGTDTPLSYGNLDTDFSKKGNMGDKSLAAGEARYIAGPTRWWFPHDARFNDGAFLPTNVGQYEPNTWGLHDMHGNVAEWTQSPYKPYPYADDKGRNDADAKCKRVVRGGSWYDRPKRCTSSYRFGYRDYQKVYNVGFRVVMAE